MKRISYYDGRGIVVGACPRTRDRVSGRMLAAGDDVQRSTSCSEGERGGRQQRDRKLSGNGWRRRRRTSTTSQMSARPSRPCGRKIMKAIRIEKTIRSVTTYFFFFFFFFFFFRVDVAAHRLSCEPEISPPPSRPAPSRSADRGGRKFFSPATKRSRPSSARGSRRRACGSCERRASEGEDDTR